MKEIKRNGLFLMVLVLALLAYFGVWMPGCETAGLLEVGKPAPTFTGVEFRTGDAIDLDSYKGKKYVVLDFWATWCGPCIQEFPVLEGFYQDYSDQVEIIGITSDGPNQVSIIQEKLDETGATFPVIHDHTKAISSLYPSNSLPYVIFIDKDGTVLKIKVGFNENVDKEIIEVFGLSEPGEMEIETEPVMEEKPGSVTGEEPVVDESTDESGVEGEPVIDNGDGG